MNHQILSKPTFMLTTLLVLTALPSQAQSAKAIKEKIAGIAGYAYCKVRESGYSVERASAIIDGAIESQGWQRYRSWMTTKHGAKTINLVSLSMNSSCTQLDPSSPYIKQAEQAIKQIR